MSIFYTTKMVIVVNREKKGLVANVCADTHACHSRNNVYSNRIHEEASMSTMETYFRVGQQYPVVF